MHGNPSHRKATLDLPHETHKALRNLHALPLCVRVGKKLRPGEGWILVPCLAIIVAAAPVFLTGRDWFETSIRGCMRECAVAEVSQECRTGGKWASWRFLRTLELVAGDVLLSHAVCGP